MTVVKRIRHYAGAVVEALALYVAFIMGIRYGMPALDAWWGSWPLGWLARDLGLLLALGALLLLVDRFGVLSSQTDIERRSMRRNLAWTAAAIAALGLLAVLVRILDPGYDDWEFGRHGLDNLSALWRFLVTLPLAVIVEEFVFRACQRRLRFIGGSLFAVLAITGAFAWIHVRIAPGMAFHEMTATAAFLAGGLLLATLFELSRSVPLLIGVHLAYDFLAVAQGWLHVQRRFVAEVILFAIWITLSVLAFAVLRFWGTTRNRQHRTTTDAS